MTVLAMIYGSRKDPPSWKFECETQTFVIAANSKKFPLNDCFHQKDKSYSYSTCATLNLISSWQVLTGF